MFSFSCLVGKKKKKKMVRVRVKILDHEGASKKKDLIECISGAEAYVNKIVSSKEAFFLITDNCNMDKLLGEEVK